MTDNEDLFSASTMPDRVWWAELWPSPENIVHRMGIAAGQRVVDLCCGDGYFCAPIADVVGPQGAVYAVDLDPAMLEAAKAFSQSYGGDTSHCHWVAGDAMKLDQLIDTSIDTVWMANTFHGVPDKTALARAVAGTLKSKGTFIVINWHSRPREDTPVLGQPRGPASDLRLTPEQTAAFVEPAGFRLEKLIELPPFHYGAIFSKVAIAETA